MSLSRKNHYIPQFYLKKWSYDGKNVFLHRLLVSNQKVPMIENKAISRIAYYNDLYTDLVAGEEVDKFEKWIDKEYENPARDVFEKVRIGKSLSKSDYDILFKFTVLQHIRTPAYFVRNYERWINELKEILDNMNINEMIDNARNREDVLPEFGQEHLTLKVNTTKVKEDKFVEVQASVGRGLWLYNIKNIMLRTISLFPNHKWSIMQPPIGFRWPLTDNPVMLLNYSNEKDYTFTGGWGNNGTEVIMPITPEHLLYTQVGHNNPSYINLTFDKAQRLKELIVENAHEYVFTDCADESILSIRPRVVDKYSFNLQREQWQRWSEMQKSVDEDYKSKANSNTV